MKHIIYYAIAFVLALSVAACSKTDNPGIGDDMQQIEGIALGLGTVETSSQTTTRATVDGVTYAVNTSEDPTYSGNFIANRSSWLLDFHLFNNNVASSDKYEDGSFDEGKYDAVTSSWKPDPSKELRFPNYFRPHVEAWLYPNTKDKTVAKDQSDRDDFLAQDILHRTKSQLNPIAKKITIELNHRRAMINFKFGDIVRDDIDELSVRVRLGTGDENLYTPYNVTKSDVADNLEFMLILPETASTAGGMTVEYKTKGNDDIQQPIDYVQKVSLNNSAALGSNNCYCFTLSGKELKISPVTIVNWTTGEPVSGEYVAVTAYPTFKGPENSTYYFYYDNRLKEADGTTPKLQTITFNNEGECTVKTDGRTITHIFKSNNPNNGEDWNTYKLNPHIILGNAEKMYIDLTTKNIPAFN